jgi:branched-chain amino acid transport system ATP-binding protein
MLEVRDLRVHYGTVEAVKGVSFHLDAGEMISLIGANGAGKSTILRALTGLVQPSAGTITFENSTMVGLSPH